MNIGDIVRTKNTQKEFTVIRKEPASRSDQKIYLYNDSDGQTYIYYESDLEIAQEAKEAKEAKEEKRKHSLGIIEKIKTYILKVKCLT